MAGLTLEQCINMQDLLITGYMTQDFQETMWKAYAESGGDALKWAKARQELCLPIQGPILEKFGYEASRAGVAESTKAFTPEINQNKDIVERNNIMTYLISPDQQDLVLQAKVKAPVGIPPNMAKMPDPKEWEKPIYKVWKVVGGADKGGIVVRQGEDVKSPEMAKRLATGSKFEEIERAGDRIKFERIDGAGPDIGWVSTNFKGKALIEPLWFVADDAEVAIKEQAPKGARLAKKETWKVVHDRVAKRAEMSKDAQMLGMEKKDATVKGTVVENDGVQWLKIRTKGMGDKANKDVDAYMMIDGASVGLGKLMEKVE